VGTGTGWRWVRPLALVVLVCAVIGCSSPAPVTVPSVPPTATPTATVAAPTATAEAALPALATLSAPAYQPTTRTEELEAETADPTSEPTLQQAIDMFSVTITPLPGATQTDLPAGEGVGATVAMDAILEHIDELSSAQAKIVDSFVDAPYVELDATGKQIGSTLPGESATTARGFAPSEVSRVAHKNPLTSESQSYYDHYLPILAGVIADYHQKLPTLIAGVTGYWLSVLDETPADEDGALLFSGLAPGQPGVCHINVLHEFIERGYSDEDAKFSFAHEIFHCIQRTISPDRPLNQVHWLIEGSATFAAEYLYHDTLTVNDNILPMNWFLYTAEPLDDASYHAWALFEAYHQQYPGADVFADIRAMLTAPTESTTAQLLAIGGFSAPTFENLWTSTSLRSSTFPDQPWQFAWPGVDPKRGPPDNVTTVLSPGGSTYGVGTYDVDGRAGFVHEGLALPIDPEVGLIGVIPHQGPMMTQADGKTVSIGEGQEKWFCTDTNKCPCPDGSTPKVDLTPLVPPMILALSTTEAMPFVHVTAEKWNPDKDCNDPAASGTPGGGKPMVAGNANGDPHMTTYNGLSYNFMSLGEFVTTMDPSGDMVVQERHQPVGSGATIGAVAIGSGTDRATFTATDESMTGGITVRLDGQTITDATFSIGSVAVADAGNHSWTATWPDGSTIAVLWNRGFFIKARLTEDRARKAKGALGTYGDNFLGDLALPDGTAASPDDNYKQFADAWLVTDTTSLFDYDPGQDTETFRSAQPLTTIVDPSLATVTLCTTTLGQDATSSELGSCEFDITATNDTSYATAYAQVTDDRVASLPTGADIAPPTASSGPATGPITVGSPEPGTGGPQPVSNGTTPSIASLTLQGTVAFLPSQVTQDVYLAGSITLQKDTVLIVKATCPPGGKFDMNVEITARSGDGRGGVGVCGQAWASETYNANQNGEVHEGEGWIFVREAGTYDVKASTDEEDSAQVSVELYSDTTPTVVSSDDIAKTGTYSTTLSSIADTVVVDVAPGNGSDWNITNGDKLCTQIYYVAAADDPQKDPDDLGGVCWHHATISVGPASTTVPIFIFNRDGTPITITVTRKD
jgi:von Willebrand factor type D domain